MKKVVIFGAAGFTGIHFENYIHENKLYKDYTFIGFDIREINNSIECRKLNLLEPLKIEEVLVSEQPDYIINFIGKFGSDNFDELLSLNVTVTQYILNSIVRKQIQVKNILFIGTAAEYGDVKLLPVSEDCPLNPVNLYGLTKALQTQLTNYYYCQYKVPFIMARTFNVIGEGLSVDLSIGSFLKQIKQANDGDTIYVGNVNTKRDFLPIEKVVDCYWKLLMYGNSGEVYNVCSGKSVTIRSILDDLIVSSGKRLKIEINPKYYKKNDILDIYGDNSKLLELINR